MATKIFLKIWSVLISSLALFSADIGSQAKVSHAVNIQALWQLPMRKDSKPALFLQQTAQEESIVTAAHRSHSSHRSHASHASHVSGANVRGPSESTVIPDTPPSQSGIVPSNTTVERTPSYMQKSITPQNINNKMIFMTSGATISCDSSWIAEGKLFFTKSGKTYSLPIQDVDLRKTSVGKSK